MNKGFVNPYNFISFPAHKAKAYTDSDRHTGVIHYTVTTKSPLFIPNSSSAQAFTESDKDRDHKSYDFFSYTELDEGERYENVYHTPVIPGSEMRGVVRSVYEALTDSCMGNLNENTYPVKRSAARFNPGLICRDKYGRYTLHAAESLRIAMQSDDKDGDMRNLKDGEIVHFSNPQRGDKRQPKPIRFYGRKSPQHVKNGYLIKWGMGVKKAYYHVFVDKNMTENIRSINSNGGEDLHEKLKAVVMSYLEQPALKSENKKAYEDYMAAMDSFFAGKGEGCFPINYSIEGKGASQLFYPAPAVYSKEVSMRNLRQLAGEFAPCDAPDNADRCPACDLFGYIGSGKGRGKASHIRFADLQVKNVGDPKGLYMCDKITLQALGEPKLGNVEFYLKKPTDHASYWTYDYYVENGKLYVKTGALRGRKFYWHNQNVFKKSVEVSKLNKTVRPVKENVSFTGELFFEDISEKQLKQLVWILNSGSEKLGLKLGGAKPLGFGSVSCRVDQVSERSISIQDGKLSYRVDQVNVSGLNYEEAGFSTAVQKEFYMIAGLESIPADVEITYPKDIRQKDQAIDKGYTWFVDNHGRGMPKAREDALIKNALPGILDVLKHPLEYCESGNGRSMRADKSSNGSFHNGGYRRGNGGYSGGGKWH